MSLPQKAVVVRTVKRKQNEVQDVLPTESDVIVLDGNGAVTQTTEAPKAKKKKTPELPQDVEIKQKAMPPLITPETRPSGTLDRWIVRKTKLNLQGNKVSSVSLLLRSSMVPFLQFYATFSNELLFPRLSALSINDTIELKNYSAFNTNVTIFGDADNRASVLFPQTPTVDDDDII